MATAIGNAPQIRFVAEQNSRRVLPAREAVVRRFLCGSAAEESHTAQCHGQSAKRNGPTVGSKGLAGGLKHGQGLGLGGSVRQRLHPLLDPFKCPFVGNIVHKYHTLSTLPVPTIANNKRAAKMGEAADTLMTAVRWRDGLVLLVPLLVCCCTVRSIKLITTGL